MDIHELLNKLKASCKSRLASDSENAAVAAIEEHLANSVPIVSKEPDGYPRLGCGSLVKFDKYVYATDGTRFKIPNRDKILVRDDSGEVTYSRNLADLFAAPPKPVTPVDALRQIHELLCVIETPTHCENLALSIARDVLLAQWENGFTCPKCGSHEVQHAGDGLYRCTYCYCDWSGDNTAFRAACQILDNPAE